VPKNHYPLLKSRLYVKFCLAYALDNILTSMRDLFKRLNNTGIDFKISTFSTDNTHIFQEIFQIFYHQSNQLFQTKLHKKYVICPIDSTLITLISKLLWVLGTN
jgi:putative transposase